MKLREFNIRFIIFFLLIIVLSCTSQQKKVNTIESTDTIIPDSLSNFFPIKREGDLYKKYFYNTNAIESKHPSNTQKEFKVFFKLKGIDYGLRLADNIDSLKENLEKSAIDKYLASDTSYIVISSEGRLSQQYTLEELMKIYTAPHQGRQILPDFAEMLDDNSSGISDNTTLCKLPQNYEVYIFKSGKTCVLPSNYCYDWSVLPNELKHGYTSGVAFNKDSSYIIYWVVAW